ncbi:MAG: hypothetical protein ACXWA3_19480, partial [Acidimicrobiales bacterium]
NGTPSSTYTCHGGSIPGGLYRSVEVAGVCTLDAGSVSVAGPVTVDTGAGLIAAFGGSNLVVRGNLVVQPHGNLILGCEPEAFKCLNDPDVNDDSAPGTLLTEDVIFGRLIGYGADTMLVHHNTIARGVASLGGGGGVTCDNFPLGPDGPPAYTTYEDNTIGGAAEIIGVQTCWIGFIRNTVQRTVTFVANETFDPDGNEVVSNTIGRNLVCNGNTPAAQIGDSSGSPNSVGGRATGECKALVGSSSSVSPLV